MKLTLKTLLVVISFAWCVNSHADDVNCSLITSEEQLVDGGLYIITYKATNNKKSYHTLVYKVYNASVADSIYIFNYKDYINENYPSISSEFIHNTTIFKMVKKDGYWLMMNTGNKKYIGRVTRNAYNGSIPVSPYFIYFLHSKYPNEYFHISFDINGNLLIGGDYFIYYSNVNTGYVIKLSIDKYNDKAVSLYKLPDGYDEKRINANDNLLKTSYTGNATFERTFYDGYYNTLTLPFDVSNYKKVFGSGTTAYKFISASDNSICFNEIADDETIKSNTPYLINGTFSGNPYFVANTSIIYDGSGNMEYKLGDVTFNNVYQTTDIGKTNAFILHKDAFYTCTDVDKMEISPYKWYVTTGSTSQEAKRLIINDEDAATGIKPINTMTKNNEIYNLQGMKIMTDWSSLPKGIYIVNKKKMIKK